jgi:hypothetical protein
MRGSWGRQGCFEQVSADTHDTIAKVCQQAPYCILHLSANAAAKGNLKQGCYLLRVPFCLDGHLLSFPALEVGYLRVLLRKQEMQIVDDVCIMRACGTNGCFRAPTR